MADYTPQQIEEILREFFDVAGTRQYIGARYVPLIGRKGEATTDWDGGQAAYEPLTIVTYQGRSYTSRQYVPSGVSITDADFWVLTADYNAQIAEYRARTVEVEGKLDDLTRRIDEVGSESALAISAVADSLPSTAFTPQNTVQSYIDDSFRQLAIDALDDYVPFPASPLPKYGTEGQVLKTDGTGGTEWVNPNLPSEAAMEAAIADWLDAHPEATTSILDGAVTTAKLANGAVTDEKLAASGIKKVVTDLVTKFDREKVGGIVTTSANILDSRTASGKLPAQLDQARFYFGPDIDVTDPLVRAVPVRIHISKSDGDLTGIYTKWIRADGTTTATNTSFDTSMSLASDYVGLLVGAYGVATASPITLISVVFCKDPAHVVNDQYSCEIADWSYDPNPLSALYDNFVKEAVDPSYSQPGLITNALAVWGTQYPQYYQHYDMPVEPGEWYAISGCHYASGYQPYILAHDDRMMYMFDFAGIQFPATDTAYEFVMQIPRGVNRLLVNCKLDESIGFVGKVEGASDGSFWSGKRIVWFGTSIPAGNASAGGTVQALSYPVEIGRRLGCTMYNEAVGSSCVRAGSHEHITADDPMGWAGMNAVSLMYSLSLSSAEKQEIIDNWNSTWSSIITIGASGLVFDTEHINGYKNSSWDVKLAKYLTGGSVGPCDLYVIDHGYNDSVDTYGYTDFETEPASYSDRTYFIGAMDYIVRKILDDNPRARILIIGHYNHTEDAFARGANYSGALVCDGQENYAGLWGFPCVRTWELLGLTMRRINSDTMPVLYARYPDHLHPSSDTTGAELRRYADALYPFVRDIN